MLRLAPLLQVVTVYLAIVDAAPQLSGKANTFSGLVGSLASGRSHLQFVDSKPLKPFIRPTAKRAVLRYGPLELVGKDMKKPAGQSISLDQNGQGGIGIISKGVCSHCTVLAARWSLSYEGGNEATPANGVYIHHIISFDTSKAPSNPIGTCESNSTSSAGKSPLSRLASFVDRGEDGGDAHTVFTSTDGEYDSGFHLGKNRTIAVNFDLVNYDNITKKVYINLDIEYMDGIIGRDAGHTRKSVTGCGVSAPQVSQTGPAITVSRKMPILADATIVWARGHIHAGGEKMVLMVNDKEACVSEPKYNSDGIIVDMNMCPKPIQVKKGDYINILSIYDLTKHPLRKSADGTGQATQSVRGGPDVMGMFLITYTKD